MKRAPLAVLALVALMLAGAKQKATAARPVVVRTSDAPKPKPLAPPASAPVAPAEDPAITATLSEARIDATSACNSCHTAKKWSAVSIAHERTGFALRGEHADVQCRACHPVSVKTPVPKECSGCHRDPHNATLGFRCETCHDERSWKSTMSADAHRTGLFPLVGAHAIVPCEECHTQARDRGFSRVAVACRDCHQDAYARTASTSIDHTAAGFPTDCRQCHSVFRFSPARFPAHDQCFRISGGPHASVSCRSCHTSLAGAQATGQCVTETAACSQCHTHACDRMDARHQSVPGYQCRDRKCYECHEARGALP